QGHSLSRQVPVRRGYSSWATDAPRPHLPEEHPMRTTVRLMSLGLLASLVALPALADEKDDGPATREQMWEAEERASSIDLIVDAARLEGSAARFRSAPLYAAAGVMYLQAKGLERRFKPIKDAPEGAKPDEKPEEDVPMEARAKRVFKLARELGGG